MRAATIAPTYSGMPTGVQPEDWTRCHDSVKQHWITYDRHVDRDADLAESIHGVALRNGWKWARAEASTRRLVRRVRRMRTR